MFTPNGDGINDVFLINNTALETLHYEIYNRWGTKIFETNSMDERWDGHTTSGSECKEGIYFVILTAKGWDDVDYNQTGFIQLLK